ncbi:SIMPL domain-containing protein [Methylocapsa palsarum]|uniref:26 kDa periplasmic immunogenic protein n=1 Tax=Methylocapsa palsarum TaxID=1612308 RepID=A0A1I4A858_9HYPH|nr:SIMPL domain-containing protein [Methylocapsa palsarum]SFK52602.1 hypothetical protein SAMN05444581_109141 [Methylocapsa palsarum]
MSAHRTFSVQILALAAAWGIAPLVARADECLLKNSVPSITTTGSASAEVEPNIATITLGAVTERPTASEAASENARAAQAIVAEIKAQGVEARDVRTLAVTLSPVYDETLDANGRLIKRKLRGYSARNDLSIRVRQMAKAGALARQLIDKGANSFGGVVFEYESREEKFDALRTAAVRDALRKATSYVNGLGLKLGRVLEISTPSPHAFAPAAMAKSVQSDPASAIPIEPGVETLQTDVQVSWELAQ